MKRTLPFLIVMVMAILGWVVTAPTAAGAVPERPCVTYTYDVPAYDAPGAGAVSERGPPASSDRGTTYDAVDFGSRDTLACPGGLAASSSTFTAYPARHAQAALATPTTHRHVVLAHGDRSSPERTGVAAKYADDAIEGLGDARSYVNLTKGGSIRNVGTNTTHTEFAETLTSGGWISRTSKDGAVQIFQRDGAKYVLRSKNSSGYAGWTADFTPAGSTRHTLEIRLGYVP